MLLRLYSAKNEVKRYCGEVKTRQVMKNCPSLPVLWKAIDHERRANHWVSAPIAATRTIIKAGLRK